MMSEVLILMKTTTEIITEIQTDQLTIETESKINQPIRDAEVVVVNLTEYSNIIKQL
jgi:hypothetical protein